VSLMPQYVRLLEEKRTLRRTIADAIEVLYESADFKAEDHAEIRVKPIEFPSGTIVGVIILEFKAPTSEKIFVVSLPASTRFRAVRQGSSQRECFEISRLDGAPVDSAGNVTLDNGEPIRALELIPSRLLSYEPSQLDWFIVHSTVAVLGEERRCYRHLGEGLPSPYREMVPDELRFLDHSALTKLKAPFLKVIAGYIEQRFPHLAVPSEQKIADALARFGIRHPRPRRRRH
jgi:hypothetical protein